MTTPPFDDNPFRSPDHAAPSAPVPGRQPIPHWFTTKVKITLAACVVLALALGSLGALSIYWADRAGPPGSGDCVYLSRESGDKIAYHRVGCGSDSAAYQVEQSYSGSSTCASNGYVRFKIAAGRTLCLALNVSTGDCLRDADDEVKVAKVSCTDPAATERVQVITGPHDPGTCGKADDIRYYAGPPTRAVCLTPPGESI
ncbi:LppU/SCO3897 family protein [Amycolatopsis sp. NPDC004378]